MTEETIDTFRFRKSVVQVGGKDQYEIEVYDVADTEFTNPLFSYRHWDVHVIDPVFDQLKALVLAIYRKANREILDKIKQSPQ